MEKVQKPSNSECQQFMIYVIGVEKQILKKYAAKWRMPVFLRKKLDPKSDISQRSRSLLRKIRAD
jgi:hypothetical protein